MYFKVSESMMQQKAKNNLNDSICCELPKATGETGRVDQKT